MSNSNGAQQETKLLTGNEAAAEAAKAIDFHFMGFYPITPSTEIAQILDAMKSRGEISTVLLPADGEHGAAGACFGASTGGGRVFNATSANGLLYSLEQLPVQSGSRLPMVLNLVTRSISGPLDIRCDHSDLMFALQTGWLILLAPNPQAVYDMNLIAIRLGEHPDVRLPVMVVSDGFFTSHQRRSVKVLSKKDDANRFLGSRQDTHTSLDPRNPVTFGPYMNDPDLINNKYQLHVAHEAAARVFDEVVIEFEQLTGRSYKRLEAYKCEDADVALFVLNSAAETAMDAVDRLRAEGKKVGLIKPHLLRPFPSVELQKITHRIPVVVIAERSDTPGSSGGPLSHEVRSALLADHHCDVQAISRVFGLGGRDFREDDAVALYEEGFRALKNPGEVPTFGFVGLREGSKKTLPPQVLPPLSQADVSPGLVKTKQLENGQLQVTIADIAELATKPKRLAPGHGACPGCGIFSGLDQFFKGLEGDVVVLYHTGCAMVVTTDYPFSSHRVTYLHNLFQNGAPTLSGLVEMFHERRRRGEIEVSEDLTFVMITGDGGMDIGMGPTIGTALRNHQMIILEYDNQGYMNTGGQLSYTTPMGRATSTSHSGKSFHHKDTVAIMAATGIPYVFTGIEGYGTDLIEKAAKAQWYARNEGLAFGKILITCPLNWGSEERLGQTILQNAVECCFFPLYEIEHGITKINYDPETLGKKVGVDVWLKQLGKSKMLLEERNRPLLNAFQGEVDRRWARLKAMAAHPLL